MIEETIKHFSKPGTFVKDAYFEHKSPNGAAAAAGDNVSATCAIGGVEQALWKLTGKVITEDERMALAKELPDPSYYKVRDDAVVKLYGSTMKLLNRTARKLYPTVSEKYFDEVDVIKISTIEQLTFYGSDLAAKRRVMRILRTALAELS